MIRVHAFHIKAVFLCQSFSSVLTSDKLPGNIMRNIWSNIWYLVHFVRSPSDFDMETSDSEDHRQAAYGCNTRHGHRKSQVRTKPGRQKDEKNVAAVMAIVPLTIKIRRRDEPSAPGGQICQQGETDSCLFGLPPAQRNMQQLWSQQRPPSVQVQAATLLRFWGPGSATQTSTAPWTSGPLPSWYWLIDFRLKIYMHIEQLMTHHVLIRLIIMLCDIYHCYLHLFSQLSHIISIIMY